MSDAYNIINNQVVVRGQPGPAGITPHIDPITKHWMIGEVDTGVAAYGVTLIERYDNIYQMPLLGSEHVLYIVGNSSYFWNKDKTAYEQIVPVINIIRCGNSIE